jgi:lipid-A-disaccharide synthase
MVNLIAGRRIVPELLQDRFNPETLSETLASLLDDTPLRARQMEGLAEVRAKLATVGATSIDRVRDAVLAELFKQSAEAARTLGP